MVRGVRICMALLMLAVTATGMRAARMADTANGIFNERVRTLEVKNVRSPYMMPGEAVMVLGESDAVTIEFDVLSDDRDYLRYELVHCNADWQPSSLAYVEYLDGFNEGTIDDYAFSHGTLVHYVHYRLTIPNDEVRPTASGNYLVKIYPEGDPDEVWLQCRFAVTEQTAAIGTHLTSRTDVDYNRAHQQLELAVDLERADVTDVFNDVTVVIEQNGRPDTRRTLRKPLRTSGRRIFYEHVPELIFKAGNEYRRFETVSSRNSGMGVDHIEWIAPYYHYVLEADGSRAGESYHYDETLSGGFTVREYNSDNGATEADYGVVHFTLDYPELPGFDIYIDGDMVQRRFSPESRMVFNRASGCYEHAMLLKQGAYSYQYVAVKPGTDEGRTDVIEGDKYETGNRYTIYVYSRKPGERADRLIGVASI